MVIDIETTLATGQCSLPSESIGGDDLCVMIDAHSTLAKGQCSRHSECNNANEEHCHAGEFFVLSVKIFGMQCVLFQQPIRTMSN